ncbi:hypothetical protein L195_g015791 [Trifolium pratense]|uniref:Uncharacterized protein n=1 Tax=Trifolium pratense TaxID=57577 RepID=A0A2K3MPB5_TRIPR|nr:hypothetical protein L195_g015791 [Trifolium pratense]
MNSAITVQVFYTPNNALVTQQVAQIPPTASCLNLNVDDSSFGNPARPSFGAYAILKELQLDWGLGYHTITFESNPKSAIDLILEDDNNFQPHTIVLG